MLDLISSQQVPAGQREYSRWLSNFANPDNGPVAMQETGPDTIRRLSHDKVSIKPNSYGIAVGWTEELDIASPGYRSAMMEVLLEGWMVDMEYRIFKAFVSDGLAGSNGAPARFPGHAKNSNASGGGYLDPAQLLYVDANHTDDGYWFKIAAKIRRYFRQRNYLAPDLTMFVEPALAEVLETNFTNPRAGNEVALSGGTMYDISTRLTNHIAADLNVSRTGFAGNKNVKSTGAGIVGAWKDLTRFQWGGVLTMTNPYRYDHQTVYSLKAFEDFLAMHDDRNVPNGTGGDGLGEHGWFLRLFNDTISA